MKIDTENMFSISQANQNFSYIVKEVESKGDVIILKNNKPRYVVSKFSESVISENDAIELIARRILSKHEKAFKELAK